MVSRAVLYCVVLRGIIRDCSVLYFAGWYWSGYFWSYLVFVVVCGSMWIVLNPAVLFVIVWFFWYFWCFLVLGGIAWNCVVLRGRPW